MTRRLYGVTTSNQSITPNRAESCPEQNQQVTGAYKLAEFCEAPQIIQASRGQ